MIINIAIFILIWFLIIFRFGLLNEKHRLLQLKEKRSIVPILRTLIHREKSLLVLSKKLLLSASVFVAIFFIISSANVETNLLVFTCTLLVSIALEEWPLTLDLSIIVLVLSMVKSLTTHHLVIYLLFFYSIVQLWVIFMSLREGKSLLRFGLRVSLLSILIDKLNTEHSFLDYFLIKNEVFMYFSILLISLLANKVVHTSE